MDLELLRNLTQTFGPSGYEDTIRAVIRQVVEPLATEVRVDPLGSLVAYRKGDGGGKKIMLAAHMDEIGMMVSYIEEKGFLRFTSIGGVWSSNRTGGRAVFADGSIGVVYADYDTTHEGKFPELQKLYIDAGFTSRDSCPIKIGDPVVFYGPLVQQGNRLISKAMDNRIGCYVLIEVLRRLTASPHELYFVFTTQEEITLSGARTAAYRIAPDLGIAVDITTTGDTPKEPQMAVDLGKGPAVKIKDSGQIAHPAVRDMLIQAAESAGIPYQREVLLRGGTDASAIQVAHAGVPSGCLSIPTRYVHSAVEMIDINDVENSVNLLLAALSRPAI